MASGRPTSLGKFEVLTRIAKGGMAEIYLARQKGIVGFSRTVVVKRIMPHLAEEPQFIEMFMEEARLAALINHANVVQIHDVGCEGGEYYIAMEFIRGPSVGVINRRARETAMPVPYAAAAEIIAQACDGLHAAHELRDSAGKLLNVVHRDISPHNLMMTLSGRVKLLDFGIAKAHDTAVKTTTGSIKGKFPYMSPEQCRGEPLDRRTDIFSLGIVFFELIAARRLFQRPTELMTLKAITEERIPDPREFNRHLPASISQVIFTAMQRDREARYRTAQEFGSDLRRALNGLAIQTSPETLAGYIEHDCQDILARRDSTISDAMAQSESRTRPVDELARTAKSSKPKKPARLSALTDSVDAGDSASASDGSQSTRRRRWLLPVALLAIVLGAGAGLVYRFALQPQRPTGPALRFGLPPAFEAKVGRRELQPFIHYLERKLHRRVELVVPTTYRELRMGLLRGELHFAHLPPLQYVLARHSAPSLRALVTQVYEGARTYQGLIVRRDDSRIKILGDLRGSRFCFVDRGSTSGYLMPRHFLRQQGLDPDRIFASTHISGTHAQVMRDVMAGKCDAGAIYSGAKANARKFGIAAPRLQSLAITGQLPYDVICASPTLTDKLATRIREVLIALDPKRDLGSATVGPDVYRISRFVEPQLGDFSAVEAAAKAEGALDLGGDAPEPPKRRHEPVADAG